MADKEPRPGEHETFIKPLWKQGVGSRIHCVAGDATGIILAAVVTAVLNTSRPSSISWTATGRWENVRKSFIPEFISMNFMMAGMAPVMRFCDDGP
jgi:hypothetical protein